MHKTVFESLSAAERPAYVSRKRAVIFFGWVCFSTSLGPPPHVRRAHMGHKCGEPKEIEVTAAYR